MSSEMIKVKYIECPKGGFHDGQLLNTVCLNSECNQNALCCCVCVDEFHKGHKTTTLKKLLIDAKQAGNQIQSSSKEQVKPFSSLNNDIVSNLIQSTKKDTFQSLKQTCASIKYTLSRIEQGLALYYQSLEETIQSQGSSKQPAKIFESIQTIQGSATLSTILPALQQILCSLQEINQNKSSKSNRKQLAQDSIINLIQQSNQEVIKTTLTGLSEIENQLSKNYNFILQSTTNVKNLFNKEVFHFSTLLKSPDIWVTDSFKVVSKKGSQYQVVLMQPNISLVNDITAFRFKISKSVSNWIAIGMCHKKILVNKNFAFDYKTLGHGCYMISSNAGSWSHITQDLNNKVKAFNFKQGDTITCIVNRSMRQIFFIKDLTPGVFNVAPSQRQIYELPYVDDPFDQLHPCVVFYYENDEVEYVPAVNLNSIPKYEYLFSDVQRHPKIKVIDQKIIRALEGNSEYRAVLLNKSLQENFQASKKFSFKILKSTNNWVAIGMCHAKTAASSSYGFNYQSAFHGYYMISSNGGSWSTIDIKKNNVVKSFKFAQGDVVNCEVTFGQGPNDLQNKIVFKKGVQTYELNFKGVQGDKLYPCAMLHFPNDEICILPSF